MSPNTGRLILGLAVVALAGSSTTQASDSVVSAEVCVYGATPSGILAAIAAEREGRSVVIVEPNRWVGGMLGAGLKPTQDCPNIHATGGLTPEWDSGKQGWQWLFPIIDTDKDGRIGKREYEAFQEFKKENPDWASLRTRDHRPK